MDLTIAQRGRFVKNIYDYSQGKSWAGSEM